MNHLREFLRLEAAGGLVLMAATGVALAVANSPVGPEYREFLQVPLEVRFGTAGIEKPLILWINDGLMVPLANNQSGLDWSSIKEDFADRILTFLEEWGLDGLKETLEVLHIFTPDDFAHHLNAFHGNAFAIEPKFTQTAWFRPHNRSEDVEGLYLVGAGTHPGAGVPGVFMSAETTYGSIAEDFDLPDQWDWSEAGRVDLPEEELREVLDGGQATVSR